MTTLVTITAADDGNDVPLAGGLTLTGTGVMYFGGTPSAGRLLFGYYEPGILPVVFKPFVDGLFDDEKHISPGRGIQMVVRVTGYAGGDSTNLLWAPIEP